MSVQQTRFLGWFGGIAAVLLISVIIWTVTVLSSIDVMATNIKYNKQQIKETRLFHNKDADKVGARINEVKSNQTIMMEDIKDILKNMPK